MGVGSGRSNAHPEGRHTLTKPAHKIWGAKEGKAAPMEPVGTPLPSLLRAGPAGDAISSVPESWVDPTVPFDTCVRAPTSREIASRMHRPFLKGDHWGGDSVGPQDISQLV